MDFQNIQDQLDDNDQQKPKVLTNLSNVLGRPVDENISEADYMKAVNNLFNSKLNNNAIPKVSNGPSPAYDNILGTNRDTTNDLTRAYLNDNNPNLNLPSDNNAIVSKDQIQNIYNNLAGGMHNTNTTLDFNKDNSNSGEFKPAQARAMPDSLSAQFVPNSINYSGAAKESYNIPEILLHELAHAKDAKQYPNMSEIHPGEENNVLLAPQEKNIVDSMNATSGTHFSPEALKTLYKYPFDKLKEQLVNRITDSKNYPHYPVKE